MAKSVRVSTLVGRDAPNEKTHITTYYLDGQKRLAVVYLPNGEIVVGEQFSKEIKQKGGLERQIQKFKSFISKP